MKIKIEDSMFEIRETVNGGLFVLKKEALVLSYPMTKLNAVKELQARVSNIIFNKMYDE